MLHNGRLAKSIQHARNGPPTLADVAALAGVSTGAASMALRSHERISEETRARVKGAAEALAYVRNAAGQALREQRAGAIALVVPNTGHHVFSHPYFMYLLEGVNEAANLRDTVVMISTNDDEEHGVAAYERILRSRRTDGAIVASAAVDDPDLNRMAASGFPVVAVGGEGEGLGVSSVALPDRAAAAELCRHLVEAHGHRRIAHISGPVAHQTGRDRLAGYRDVAGGDGAALIRHGVYDEQSGMEAARHLLDSGEEWSALFCANDEMAYGALRAATSYGVRVPDDLAIVGFDDFGLARVVDPALTTIRAPAREMGRRAAECLFDVIGGSVPRHQVVDVDMVLRRSCGCLDDQVIRL